MRRQNVKHTKDNVSFFLKRKQTQKEWDNLYKFFPLNLPPKLELLLKKNREPDIDIFDIKTGYFLTGPAGVGKSYQAACMLNEIAKMNMKRNLGHWLNVPQLLNDIKKTFETKGEDLIAKYSKAPLICLDDLGTEHSTDWVMQSLYLIINSRYESMLPTIITSNYSLEELSKKFKDDRLTSRIIGMCTILNMSGKDRRKGSK